MFVVMEFGEKVPPSIPASASDPGVTNAVRGAPVCYTFIRLPPFSKLLEFWMRILTLFCRLSLADVMFTLAVVFFCFFKLCPLEIFF